MDRQGSPTGSPRRRAGRIALWHGYLCVTALLTILYGFTHQLAASSLVMGAIGLLAVIAVLVGTRRNRPAYRLPWLFFAAGLALFWLGDVYTYVLPQLFDVNVPFPSPGDAVYLSVYPVLMTGLLLLVRRRNPDRDRAGTIDSLIMTLGLSLVSWIVLIAPYVHDGSLSLLPKLVSIAYPLGDILLLAAAVRLAVDAGTRRPAFYLLALSIVTLLVTDFAYGVITLDDAYTHQLILDIGWIGFYAFWGAAALHPSMRQLEQPAAEAQPKLGPVRLTMLTAAVLIAPAIEISGEVRHHNVDLLITTIVSAILFAFVVARMAALVRERERSVARERALAGAAAEIVGATSRTKICQAALAAAGSLVQSGVTARLCFVGDGPATTMGLVDAPDPALESWTVGDETAARWLAASDASGRQLRLTERDRSTLRLAHTADSVLVIELALRGDRRTRGLLIAAGPRVGARTPRGALVALATHVSLALESNALTEEIHLRRGQARFRSLVQNAHDLITVLDWAGRISYQSPSIERTLGYPVDQVLGAPFAQLIAPADSGRIAHLLDERPHQATRDAEVIECSLVHRDGTARQFEILVTNLLDDDDVHGIVLNARDISERKAFERQLEHQAFHDPVTSLPNRALFNERVRHALARARREHGTLAVIFLDLDDFKTINDSLGHAAGDQVLLEVAKRLETSVRVTDTAARFGGDEFAILLEDITGPQEAADVAERIGEALLPAMVLEQQEIVVQASLGISIADYDTTLNADQLISNADAAMYIAKRDGKATYRLFEPEMHAGVLARLQLRADLQRAIANEEFALYYQPVFRLSDASISGVEALLRWCHPERGLIGPDEFIPFAEESGLIVPIGRWVLHQGCRQAKANQELHPSDPPLTMNINISVNQLHHADIVADVAAALAESGLDPATLTLEITETVMMANTELADQRLAALKRLGVRIALDDFGTGYSSLGYLARFPVDIIKMDRSFLGARAAPISSGLATTVIGLGKTFDLDVVAEGIELPEQWTKLEELGCQLGQGFYFARPMDTATTIAFLTSQTGPPKPVGAGEQRAPDQT